MLFISETLPESGQKFWTSKKNPACVTQKEI